tara:strand:+ start:1253 stop:1417 length:165 start_codon:yes stop_codon:yes gene_type:complete
MSGNELFYRDFGKKKDEKLHLPILKSGNIDLIEYTQRAKRLNLTDEEISILYRK